MSDDDIQGRTARYAQTIFDNVMGTEDIRTEVYAKEVGRVESYMVAGNGPTAYVVFVFDGEGDLDYAFMHFMDGHDAAVHLYGQFAGEDLYRKMKGYQA